MQEFLLPRRPAKGDKYLDPDNVKARKNAIKLGAFDLLLAILDEKTLKNKYNLVLAEEDLVAGEITAMGFILQDLNDCKKWDLVLMSREFVSIYEDKIGVVGSYVTHLIPKDRLAEFAKDGTIIVRWERSCK